MGLVFELKATLFEQKFPFKKTTMKLITEELIDKVSLRIAENDDSLESLVNDFEKNQPNVIGFILSEEVLSLDREEREYLLYLSMVVWKTYQESGNEFTLIDQKELGEVEDSNWEVINNSSAKTFRDRISPFFEGYEQEDLLAFVEDALVEDEDSFVSKAGREIMFVALKTIIDCFNK